jgi:hypothetical protein
LPEREPIDSFPKTVRINVFIYASLNNSLSILLVFMGTVPALRGLGWPGCEFFVLSHDGVQPAGYSLWKAKIKIEKKKSMNDSATSKETESDRNQSKENSYVSHPLLHPLLLAPKPHKP